MAYADKMKKKQGGGSEPFNPNGPKMSSSPQVKPGYESPPFNPNDGPVNEAPEVPQAGPGPRMHGPRPQGPGGRPIGGPTGSPNPQVKPGMSDEQKAAWFEKYKNSRPGRNQMQVKPLPGGGVMPINQGVRPSYQNPNYPGNSNMDIKPMPMPGQIPGMKPPQQAGGGPQMPPGYEYMAHPNNPLYQQILNSRGMNTGAPGAPGSPAQAGPQDLMQSQNGGGLQVAGPGGWTQPSFTNWQGFPTPQNPGGTYRPQQTFNPQGGIGPIRSGQFNPQEVMQQLQGQYGQF